MQIKSFYINNFRSLVNLSLKEFDKTTIFYGENNAGKSNVLNALYIIFQRKKKDVNEQPQNFYEGIIENFANNFHGNNTNKINFIVEIEANHTELFFHDDVKNLFKKANTHIFKVTGEIIKLTNEIARIETTSILLDNRVIYNFDGKVAFFPNKSGKKNVDAGILNEAFALLVEPLNDCISIINSNRDMYPSLFGETSNIIEPKSFKNFLHTLYLSEDKHSIFEKITEVFNRAPFSFGEISFSKNETQLDIMIKNNNVRLPIKHLGSGVLQTLYIISSIIYYNHKIVCIEELEQNLSPKLQNLTLRKLQSLLNDDNTADLQQIIISSHSSVFSRPNMGFVYYLSKDNGITNIKDIKKLNQTVKETEELKKYLIHASLEPDTYSDEEMKSSIEEVINYTNSRFND